MYEVEIKVELTLQEKQTLLDVLKEKNFLSEGITPQRDFYIEAQESEFGGFNLKRYRHEGEKYIFTSKNWEMIDGQKARKEDEHEISKEEFEIAIVEFPQALKIVKDREWFVGSYEGREISATIDTVKFDHSKDMRYFIEAEIGVKDKEEVVSTKLFIIEFIKEILHKEEIVESPGMFAMAFRKL
jgi:adenylate cyclase class IV